MIFLHAIFDGLGHAPDEPDPVSSVAAREPLATRAARGQDDGILIPNSFKVSNLQQLALSGLYRESIENTKKTACLTFFFDCWVIFMMNLSYGNNMLKSS